jgi:hypothetical protein
MHFHIAQLNVGRLLHPLDHPQIAEFVNGLDAINALAERSEGFVGDFKPRPVTLPTRSIRGPRIRS